MVVVAQLVRAPDCGSGGRRFETDLPPLAVPSKRDSASPFFYALYPAVPSKGGIDCSPRVLVI